MTTVLIVDDHASVRAGLRSLLSAEPDLQVIGEAADGWEAVAKAGELQPDVLVADYNIPGPDGLAVARDLKGRLPAIQVLILTFHEDRALIHEALDAGAAGFVSKRTVLDDLIPAVRTAARGQTYVSENAHASDEDPARPQAGTRALDVEALSDTELELLLMLVKGYLPQEIAEALRIDEGAARGLRWSISNKLGLKNRAELAQYAARHGLLEDE